jgi:hypothetical protein
MEPKKPHHLYPFVLLNVSCNLLLFLMFFTSSQGGDFSEENGKSTARSSDPFSYAAIFFHRYSQISNASATMMISGTGGENIYGIPFFGM